MSFLRDRFLTCHGTTTPYGRFYRKRLYLELLKVLGSTSYALQPPGSTSKSASKTLLGTIDCYAAAVHAMRIQ